VRSPFVSRDFVLDFNANQRRTLDLKLQLERLAASVVVTAQAEPTLAQETTAPVTVITHDEIESRQSVTLPDLLLFTPAWDTAARARGGSASSFSMAENQLYQGARDGASPEASRTDAIRFHRA